MHIEIWGASPNYYLDRIQVKQNKLLRAILGIQVIEYIPVVPTADMYQSTNILTVRNLFKFYMFKFLINIIKGNLPYFYDTLLRPLEVRHRYGTRNHTFRQPFISSEVIRRSAAPQLVLIFNSIPPQIDVTTVSAPKAIKMFKEILLNNQ